MFKRKRQKGISKEQAISELEKGKKEAEEILNNPDKSESFLKDLEKKLKKVPKLGGTLVMIPTMISLVKSYIKKEYKEIPVGSIIAIISSLIYFLTPVDLIPDVITAAGFIDDAFVISICLKFISADLKQYNQWKKTKKNK